MIWIVAPAVGLLGLLVGIAVGVLATQDEPDGSPAVSPSADPDEDAFDSGVQWEILSHVCDRVRDDALQEAVELVRTSATLPEAERRIVDLSARWTPSDSGAVSP